MRKKFVAILTASILGLAFYTQAASLTFSNLSPKIPKYVDVLGVWPPIQPGSNIMDLKDIDSIEIQKTTDHALNNRFALAVYNKSTFFVVFNYMEGEGMTSENVKFTPTENGYTLDINPARGGAPLQYLKVTEGRDHTGSITLTKKARKLIPISTGFSWAKNLDIALCIIDKPGILND